MGALGDGVEEALLDFGEEEEMVVRALERALVHLGVEPLPLPSVRRLRRTVQDLVMESVGV